MKFLKEYIVLSLIIFFIIFVEIITVIITKSSLEDINHDISELEIAIYNKGDINEKMNEVIDEWKSVEEKLSYYMEHDELEKISCEVTNLKSNIELDNNEDFKEAIDEIKFRLDHVQNKQKLDLKNIF